MANTCVSSFQVKMKRRYCAETTFPQIDSHCETSKPQNVVCRGGGIGYNNNQTKLKNINHQNTSPTCFLINDETIGLFLKVSILKKNFIKKGALLWPIPRFIPKRKWPGNACRKLRILYPYTFSQVNHGKVKSVKSVCRWKIKCLPSPQFHTDPWSILNGFFVELWSS